MEKEMKYSTKCPNVLTGNETDDKVNADVRGENKMIEDYFVSIEKIIVAHKFTLKEGVECDYTGGRKFCGLICGVDGEANYFMDDGKVIPVKSGDVIFVSERAKYKVKASDRFVHYTVNFSVIPEKSYGSKIIGLLAESNIVIIREGDNSYFRHVFEKLCTCWERKMPGYTMTAMCQLYELLSQFLLINSANLAEDGRYRKILPAKNYIDEYFYKPASIDFLANLCNMSMTNFRRTFADVVGQTAMEYRASVCILRAKDYLSCQIYTIQEVSNMCGFEDTNYFCRFFKKQVGMTPGTYKKL